MKQIISIVAFFFSATSFAVDCSPLEYQELKDMTKEELIKEYCDVIKTETANKFNYALQQDAIEKLSNINRISSTRRGENNLKEAQTEADGYESQMKKCQSQRERIARLLTQNGLNLKVVKNSCPNS